MSAAAVSVLIPAYNAADTLGETLRSALGQTHAAAEILVVDDGSTDDTAEIVHDLARRHLSLRLLRQDNAGVAAARNHALAVARGDLVAPLDADDLWHPEKLARQVARLAAAGPRAGMAYCWSTDIDAAGRIVQHRLAVERAEGDVYATLVFHNFIGNGSVPLIRRALLDRVGGWDAGLRAAGAQGCEDWQLYLRLAERGDVVLAPGYLVGYRQRGTAMSRNLVAMARSYDRVMQEARERHPELPHAVFRWSRAAFDMYRAELLTEAGAPYRALGAWLRGAAADPSWLARPSTRRKLLHRLARHRRRPAPAAASYPIGLPFDQLRPEPHASQPEGQLIERREARLRRWRIRFADQ